jgi:hypothetical protein
MKKFFAVLVLAIGVAGQGLAQPPELRFAAGRTGGIYVEVASQMGRCCPSRPLAASPT